MSDLIERLEAADQYFSGRDHEVFADAKKEIERLQARVDDLEAALETANGWLHPNAPIAVYDEITEALANSEVEK